MSGDGQPPPPCRGKGCDAEGDFFAYDAGADRWEPRCTAHVRHRHPSLELHAWLAAGYLRPVERGRPTDGPVDPRGGRNRAFRDIVDRTMGWDE